MSTTYVPTGQQFEMFGEKLRRIIEFSRQIFGTSAEKLIRKLEEAGLEKPSLDELSLLLHVLMSPLRFISRVNPLLTAMLSRARISATWAPWESIQALTFIEKPEEFSSPKFIINIPFLLQLAARCWATYGKTFTRAEELESIIESLRERLSPTCREVISPLLSASQSPISGERVVERLAQLWPEPLRGSPFLEWLSMKAREELQLRLKPSLLEDMLLDIGIGLPFSAVFLHEALHGLYAHPTRTELFIRTLESKYPIVREDERIRELLEMIANLVEDAIINTELLYYIPMIYTMGNYIGGSLSNIAGRLIPELLLRWYLSGVTIRDLVHMLESAEKLKKLVSELKLRGITSISPSSREASEGLRLISEIVNPFESRREEGYDRAVLSLLEKYGVLKNLSKLSEHPHGALRSLGENIETMLREEVYSRFGYVKITPPIEELYRAVILPVVEFLSMLESIPQETEIFTPSTVAALEKTIRGGKLPPSIELTGTRAERGENRKRSPLEEIAESLETLRQVVGLLKSAGVEPLGMKREIEHLEAIQELRRLLRWIFTKYGEQLSETLTWTQVSPVERTLRRMGYNVKIPTLTRTSVPVYFLIDTSGSISEKELGRFLGTVLYLTRKYNVKPIVIFWDAEAYGPYTAETAGQVYERIIKNVSGGGGTVIKPALELLLKEIKKSGTVAPLIVMTDTEIFDIENEDTLQLLRRVSRMFFPRIWVSTYKYPPERVIELGFKPFMVVLRRE